MCTGIILSNFLYYHAQYNSGAYDLRVLFFKSFNQASFGGKNNSYTIWEIASVYPFITKSAERRQEPITKNTYMDCFQVFSVLGSRLFPVMGSRVFCCIENTSWVPWDVWARRLDVVILSLLQIMGMFCYQQCHGKIQNRERKERCQQGAVLW